MKSFTSPLLCKSPTLAFTHTHTLLFAVCLFVCVSIGKTEDCGSQLISGNELCTTKSGDDQACSDSYVEIGGQFYKCGAWGGNCVTTGPKCTAGKSAGGACSLVTEKKGRWWDKQTCHEHIKGDTNMWIHDANAVTTYHDSSISGSRGGGIKDASVWQEVEGWSAFPIGWGNGQSGNPFFQGKFTKAVKIYCMCEKYSTRGVVKNDPKHNSGQASDLCGPEVSDVGNWGGWMSMYGPKMLNANQEYTFYCANNEKGAGIIFTAA